MILAIMRSLRHLLGWVGSALSSRENLILENLALRQQLLALHAKRPRRRLTNRHKLFLGAAWSGRPAVFVYVNQRLRHHVVACNLLTASAHISFNIETCVGESTFFVSANSHS